MMITDYLSGILVIYTRITIKIGGYGYFTQTDPREYSPQYKDHKVVLLHMISDDEICWGDCGVGNFLIRAEDLENLDFSQVIYNYDCS